eukprot:634606-Prymnesium_polylepis.1
MPFFVRAHPSARLSTSGAPIVRNGDTGAAAGSQAAREWVCEDFVLQHLFRRRPWRPSVEPNLVPDY